MSYTDQKFKQQKVDQYDRGNQQANPSHHRSASEPPSDLIIQHRVSPILLRIYADNQDKKSNAIFWGAFIAIIIVLTITTTFLPQPTLIRTLPSELTATYLQSCKYPVKWDKQKRVRCGDFNPQNGSLSVGYLLNDIQNLNQFAIFYITLHTKNSSVGLNISQSLQTFFAELSKSSVDGSNGTSFFFELRGNINNQVSQFTLNSAQMGNQTSLSYTKVVQIDRFIDWNYYILILTFRNADQLKNVQSITWRVLTVNPQFTIFSIVLRYIFFIIALASFSLYLITFIKIPKGQRVIEQKLILVLGVLIILFNDPWYPVTILSPNGFSNFLSVFVVVNFIIFLIMFWIIMFDRIHFQNGQKDTNVVKWYKIAYIVLLYIFTLILYLNYAYNHLQSSPILPTDQLTSGRFLALQIITIVIAVIGFLYIFIRCIQICAKIQQKLHRNKLFCFFSLFFVIIMIVFFIIGGMRTFDYAENRVLFFYAGMNLYIFYLLRMYTVTKDQLRQVQSGFHHTESDHIIDIKQLFEEGLYLDFDGANQYNGHPNKIEGQDQIHQSIQNKPRQFNKSSKNASNVQYLKQQRQQDKVKTKSLEVQLDHPKIDFFQKRQSNSLKREPQNKEQI